MGEPDEPLDGALRRIAREIDDDDIDARLAWRAFAKEVFGRDEPAVALGRFVVRERIGAGRFGRVYAAWDPELKRSVAIKLHQRDELPDGAAEQFMREARALAQLSHPHVVKVFGFGESRHGLWFAMEHVAGTTVQAWQRAAKRPWQELVRTHLQLALGLAATHAVGIVHGDVKPGNAVIDGAGQVRLVDFGLVGAQRAPHRDDTSEGATTRAGGGTPGYAAPDQVVRGYADAKSDQFSFCVGLYEGIAGKRPFTAETIAELGRGAITTAAAYRALDGAPRRLDRVLVRGLAADPADRFDDMTALVVALRRALAGRGRGPWLAGALLVLGVGGIGAASGSICGRTPAALDDAARERLASALHGDGASGATLAEVMAALDADDRSSTDARAQVCDAKASDPIAFDRAMQCLRRVDEGRAALVDALVAEPAARDRLSELRGAVVDPQRCLAGEAVERDDPRAAAVLATIDHARVELSAGRADEALALAQTAVLAAEHAGLGATLAEACLIEGRALDELARDTEAREVLLRAGALAEAHGADTLAPRIWHALARLCAADLQVLADAERFAAQGDAALARLGHPPVLEVDGAMARAEVALLRGDAGVVEAELERALGILREQAGDDDARRVDVLERLGHAAAERGDWARSDALYRTVLDERVRRLGSTHPLVLVTRFNLGLNERARERWAEAREVFAELLEIQRDRFGSSVRYAPTLTALAEAQLRLGDLEAARRHAEEAWELQRTQLPLGHSDRSAPLALLSDIHAARVDYDAMLRVELARLADIDAVGSDLHRVELYNNIGWLLCMRGQCERAATYYARLLAMAPEGRFGIAAIHGLGRAALARADVDAARLGFERALAAALASDDEAIAYERAEIQLHLAELLTTYEPGSPRIRELARASAATYRALGIHSPDAERVARLAQ